MPGPAARLRLDCLEERAVPTAEIEPNNTSSTATSIQTPNDTLTGALSSAADIDFFRVTLQQGDVLTVKLDDQPGDLRIAPALEVLNTNLQTMTLSLDGRVATIVAPITGTYRLRLFADQVFGPFTGSYEVLTSVAAFAGTAESEPNDTSATANSIGALATFDGGLQTPTDQDWFAFSGTAGQAVAFKFGGLAASNPTIRLFDPSDTQIAVDLTGNGLVSVLPTTGTYKFAIQGDNTAGNVTGQYVGNIAVASNPLLEAEPGNDLVSATPWSVTASTSQIVGKLSSLSDIDAFLVTFSSPGAFAFRVDSPADGVGAPNRMIKAFDEFGHLLAYSDKDGQLFGFRSGQRMYVTIQATTASGFGAYSLAGSISEFPTQRDVPLYYFDFTGAIQHLGIGPAAAYNSAARPQALGFFEAAYDIYDIDVTQINPGAGVEHAAVGVGNFGSQPTPTAATLGGFGTRRVDGDSWVNTTATAGTSLSAYGPDFNIQQVLGYVSSLQHSRHPLDFMAFDRQAGINPVGTLYPFAGTDQRAPSTFTLNQRDQLDWLLQAGRYVLEVEPNVAPAAPQNLMPFLAEMTGDATTRNDRVVVAGRIDSAADVDRYQITVGENDTFTFDIEAAEFQSPLNATLSIFDSGGNLIVSSTDAMDRDSGLTSVDPYITHTLGTAGTYTIVVRGQNASIGDYRLKVTPIEAIDPDGPRVQATYPNGLSTRNGTRQIIVWLNDQLDPATLTSSNVVVTGNSTGVRAGTATFDPIDSTLIWRADAALPPDTYTVQLKSGSSGIKDLHGNQLDGEVDTSFTWPERSGDGTPGGNLSFQFTIAAADTTAASVTSSSYREHPSNRGLVTLNFNGDLDVQSLYGATITLRGAGTDGNFGTGDDTFNPVDVYYDKIAGSDSNGRVFAYTRAVPDAGSYRVEGTFLDSAGNTVNLSQAVTVTASTLAHGPVVVDLSVQPNTTIGSGTNDVVVTFGGNVNPSTLTSTSFRVRYSPNPTFYDGDDVFVADSDGTIAWDASNRKATFHSASVLTLGYYLVELEGDAGGIADPAGRLLDGEFQDSGIQGNTQPWFWKDAPSGNGIPGGDYSAYFQIADLANSLNDAPVLDNTGDMVITSIVEEDGANSGMRISDLIASAGGDRITDPDAGASEGIAIVAADTSGGTWQYSTNDGGSWASIGAVSATSARLLSTDFTSRIRLVPATDFSGTLTNALTFRAWDRTSGSSGSTANVSVNGGTTAFSGTTETARITVINVNDAPVLDNTGTTSLNATLEDSTGDAGTLITDLIASAGGNRITDPDPGALEGIAITAAVTSQGTWQYSIDNGANWSGLGAVSTAAARLLAADSATRIRFIPTVANFNGTVDPGITFRAWDRTTGTNGGTADTTSNGGGTAFSTATETAAAPVTAVNDRPSFTKGGDQTVSEDAGLQTVSGWATGMSAGPADESGQTLSFLVTTDNDALFSTLPAVSPTGTLTYTPAGNANGSATVTVRLQDNGGTANGGQDTSVEQTFQITVNAVNDAPVVSGTTPNLTPVLEDTANPAGQSISSFLAATDADTGALTGIAVTGLDNAQGGTWQYSLDGTNWNAFGSPSASAARLLRGGDQVRFIPAPDANGTATITYHAWDQTTGSAGSTVDLTVGGSTGGTTAFSSGTQTANLVITPVNDVPSFTVGTNQSVFEDSGLTTVAGWATSLSAGPANEGGQTLTFEITNNTNPGLFASGPTVSSNGTLSFQPATHANGSATITLRIKDSGGTTDGGVDTSSTQSFVIDVNAVNDAPSFTKGPNIRVMQASPPPQTIPNWATSISAGPGDESGQTLTFEVTGNTNPSLFDIQPSVDANGTLTFTPATGVNGYSTITIQLKDNGGIADGGADTSAPQTFEIGVNPINQAPSFTVGSNQSVPEDSGLQTISGWATNIDPGSPFEADQVLTFEIVSNSNTGLFAVQPSVSANGTLTFRSTNNANGSATIEVRLLDDGGTMFGGQDTSATQSFTITVTAVNDPPSFVVGTNPTVAEDSGPATLNGWATLISPGPADESGQAVTFAIRSNSNSGLFSAQPAVASDGTLTFTPAANANGSATITIYAVDTGGGSDTSPDQVFTINVTAVNDPPTFTKGADDSALEDSGNRVVPNWATAVAAGPADESGQTVVFEVSTDNNSLFEVLPAISPTGTLSYRPAVDAFGNANVTVRLKDNAGGQDTSPDQVFVITVDAVNDAPTLDDLTDEILGESSPEQTKVLPGITVGPANEASQTISSVTAVSSNPDVMANPVAEFNAGVWTLKFQPVAGKAGQATISVTVTDDGGSVNGGVNFITKTFDVDVGFRPSIDTDPVPMIDPIPVLGTVLPPGSPISMLTEHVIDSDTVPRKGIAVFEVDNSHGEWQYNLTGVLSGWQSIAPVSPTNALLLADDADTRIRFVPAKGFRGFASLQYKAWDQSNDLDEGTFADVTNPADTAYSPESERGWVAVGRTKPVVYADGSTVLPTVREDRAVSSIVSVSRVIGVVPFQAPPVGGLGIAITSASTSDGKWQFRLSKTKDWVDINPIPAGQALVLRPIDQLRFLPNPNADGAGVLAYKTWDQAGIPGQYVDPIGSHFGTELGLATLDIQAVNDAPVLDLSVPAILNPVNAGETTNAATFASMMAATDVEGVAVGVAVIGVKGTGTWQYSTDGGANWIDVGKVSTGKALFLNADAMIRFTAAATVTPGTASLSFKAWDRTRGTLGARGPASGTAVSKATEIVTAAVGNIAPVLNTTPTVTIPPTTTTTGVLVKTLLGAAITDPNGVKALKGIAVIAADNTSGKWQYSLGRNVWVDIGLVSDSSALLLSDVNKLRFVPNAGFTGPATIQYKAWDRTAGQAGDRGVDTTGVLNSFSSEIETATITVV